MAKIKGTNVQFIKSPYAVFDALDWVPWDLKTFVLLKTLINTNKLIGTVIKK